MGVIGTRSAKVRRIVVDTDADSQERLAAVLPLVFSHGWIDTLAAGRMCQTMQDFSQKASALEPLSTIATHFDYRYFLHIVYVSNHICNLVSIGREANLKGPMFISKSCALRYEP